MAIFHNALTLKNGKRGKKLDKNNAGGLCKLVKLYDVSKKQPRVEGES